MVRQDLQVFGWIWGTVRPELVAIVGVPLAVAVTIHVLLRKRDVPAAIAWIGLAWLTPVLGSALYFLFGIARVSRRAREAREPIRTSGNPDARISQAEDGFEPLREAVRTLTGHALTRGNDAAVLRSGDEAYPAMLDAIEAAATTVSLSTYILRADTVGLRFVDALAAALARGVDVRVILDGIGSGYFLPGAYGTLRRRGVPVGRFMHSALPWRMPFLNLRSHKKLLVVDRRVAFVGGLNIGDEDVRSRRPGRGVRDTHFRIVGPVVDQLADDFARDWLFVTGEEIVSVPSATAGHGRAQARVIASGPDEDIEKIEFTVLQALSCARRDVYLMTPYFLPGELLLNALAMAAMRGVAVHVLVPARSNHRSVDWASRAHIEPLLDRGVHIWSVPPPFDHSKLMVIDGMWSLVGSANMDMRSLRLNFELDVEIYDAQLAAQLTEFMQGFMRSAVTARSLVRRSLPIRLRDAAVRLALPYL